MSEAWKRSATTVDLRACLSLDTLESQEEVIASLKESFGKQEEISPCSFIHRGNMFELEPNEDFEPQRVNDAEDGYLYFRYKLLVYPLVENVALEEQVKLVKSLIAFFEGRGMRVVLLSELEVFLFDLSTRLVSEMRTVFLEKRRVSSVLKHLKREMRLDKASMMSAIAYVARAFNLRLDEAKVVASWNRFHDGTMTAADIGEVLDPLVIASLPKWNVETTSSVDEASSKIMQQAVAEYIKTGKSSVLCDQCGTKIGFYVVEKACCFSSVCYCGKYYGKHKGLSAAQ